MEQHILFWIFTGIFAISAAITLLGITNVLKIRDKYLNALFTALILEVVAVVLFLFKNTDYFNPGANLDQLITEASMTLPAQTDPAYFIVENLRESAKLSQITRQLDSLERALSDCGNQLDATTRDVNELNEAFYTKVIRLRGQIPKYQGSINLSFRPDTKTELFMLLVNILSDMGEIPAEKSMQLSDGSIDFLAVQEIYRTFKSRYTDQHLELITYDDAPQMIRKFIDYHHPRNR
jgi:hypothetical protein